MQKRNSARVIQFEKYKTNVRKPGPAIAELKVGGQNQEIQVASRRWTRQGNGFCPRASKGMQPC